MALFGPLIELLLWPWMWFHTVDRVREYFVFHLQHVHYNFEFLGVNYNNPPYPKSYPFVMTLLTMPVTTLFVDPTIDSTPIARTGSSGIAAWAACR